MRLAVFEERRVADDEVGKDQHHEEEPEDEEQDPLGEQAPDEWEVMEVVQSRVEKPVPNEKVADDESSEDEEQERGLPPHSTDAGTEASPLHPEQQPEEPGCGGGGGEIHEANDAGGAGDVQMEFGRSLVGRGIVLVLLLALVLGILRKTPNAER